MIPGRAQTILKMPSVENAKKTPTKSEFFVTQLLFMIDL